MNRSDLEVLLAAEEPEYDSVQEVEPEAVNYLYETALGDDIMAACKAVYIASIAAGEDSLPVLEAAATSTHPEVRVAVVDAALNVIGATHADVSEGSIPRAAGRLLETLARDTDDGVRFAAQSAIP